MKKIILAVALVLSLTSVSFAQTVPYKLVKLFDKTIFTNPNETSFNRTVDTAIFIGIITLCVYVYYNLSKYINTKSGYRKISFIPNYTGRKYI
jgi:hypothetical protein